MATVPQPITAYPSQHRQQLTERLNTLRTNESFCDVTVAVKGKEFKAHKVVLAAASQLFLSLVESDMKESNEQLIRIELEEATASVMEDVLKYIYTGNVSITEESVHNLIETGDYLVLPGLKTLVCDHVASNVADLSQSITADPSQHPRELTERLDTLRRNENFCDVTVAVKGKEFKAHKVVLAAASPFFLSLLESGMRESNEKLIRIELEEATASVMEDVLKYIYTGNVLVNEASAHNLIATADYLLLPGLKTLVCDFLGETVATENCVFNYYFADKYQCMELKKKSCEVVKSNFSVVMETDDFLNLDTKQVIEWVSVDDVTVSAEEDIFKGIVKWVSYNKSEREMDFPDLLHQVRLKSISHDFLVNELSKEVLITTNNQCLNFVLGSLKWMLSPTAESVTKPPRKCLETHADAIFVCGGRQALCYFPQQETWHQLAVTTFEHQDHAVVQYSRDKVFIFDGQQIGSGQSYVIEYYMPSINSCGTIQRRLNHAGCISSVTVLNGIVYAMDNNHFFGSIFSFCPDKNEWNQLVGSSRVLGLLWRSCIVSDERHLYKIGGTIMLHTFCTVERFDPNGQIWKEVASMNEERCDAFGVSMNGKIYVAGGIQMKGSISTGVVLSTCEVYNPTTNEWQQMPSLNSPRHSASMVCFRDTLYVFGGLKDISKQSRLNSVEMFNSGKNTWWKKAIIPVNHINRRERLKKSWYFKACFATLPKFALNKTSDITRWCTGYIN